MTNHELLRLSLEQRRKLKATLLDPVLFSRRVLRSNVWGLQEKILTSLARPHARVAVKACHASGKTFTAADAALYFLARYKEAIVINTAPTWNQVESVMWPEIRTIIGNSWYPYPKPLLTELNMGPKRFAMGYSTSVTKSNEGVKFQGFHAAHILIILDEAPGIDYKIWNAIDGIRAGGDVRVLALGNPTIIGGPFESAFKENRDSWDTYTISAFDTPNFDGLGISPDGTGIERLLSLSEAELGDNPRPYLTTRSWVKEKYFEWGKGHPLWDSRVLGNFPTNSDIMLIQLSWIEKANNAVSASDNLKKGALEAGIDVAGPGDNATVLIIQDSGRIVLKKSYMDSDPRGKVVADLNMYKDRITMVKVDCVGIGHNFGLHIKDQGYKVAMVNVQQTSDRPKQFVDKKAEHFWNLRDKFSKGLITGPIDETLAAQLTSIRFEYDSKGRVKIETKDEMRKRGIKSPDEAEAYMLAMAEEKVPWSGLMEYAKDESSVERKVA